MHSWKVVLARPVKILGSLCLGLIELFVTSILSLSDVQWVLGAGSIQAPTQLKGWFDCLLQARGDVERKTLWDMTLCNSLFYVPEAISFCVKATNGLNISFK